MLFTQKDNLEMNHCNKIDHNPLKFDKRYALESEKYIYIGTHNGIMRDNYGYILCILCNVIKKKKNKKGQFKKLEGVSYFSQEYTFYDIEEIRKKAKMARQSMEQRSLDIVLKKVVNETFQWL